MGHDPKPTRAERRRALSDVVGSSAAFLAAHQGAEVGAETVASGAVARALMPFLLRDDGWLRIVPQEDGATVYYKWKWTGGKHVNHYVMTVYPASECAEALRRLATKVDAVDSGVEAPVKDHYFKR